MFLSRMVLSRLAVQGGLACACFALLFGGSKAAAQYIPPDAKGYQAHVLRQQAYRSATPATATRTFPSVARSAPSVETPAAPGPVEVVVSRPARPTTVAVRGPDGKVRQFVVENGQESIIVRRVIIRPGEKIVLTIPPPITRK